MNYYQKKRGKNTENITVPPCRNTVACYQTRYIRNRDNRDTEVYFYWQVRSPKVRNGYKLRRDEVWWDSSHWISNHRGTQIRDL